MAVNVEIKPDEATSLATVVVSGLDIVKVLAIAKLASTANPALFVRNEITDLAIRGLVSSKQSAAKLSIEKDEIQRAIDAIPSVAVTVK